MTIDIGQSLLNVLIFMGPMIVIGTLILQWQWARTCDRSVRVLVAQKIGGGKWMFAPKGASDVTVKFDDGAIKTWPMNELATIEIPYPGVGFVPKFMQKNIRLAVVNEGDWEPVLNRSPHRRKVASPDVVVFLEQLADGLRESSPDVSKSIDEMLDGVSTGPTRELIGDPAVLGALKANAVMKALAEVSNDFMEMMRKVSAQLTRLTGPNPTIVYVLLGVGVIVSAIVLFQVLQIAPALQDATGMVGKVDAIYKSLGIK